MRASLRDLFQYEKTGIPSPGMRPFDKLLASQLAGGGFPITSLTGVDEIQFDSDGSPLISWYVKGNEVQTGTPSPQNIVMPQECGDLVETGEHARKYAIHITIAGQTQTIYLSEPLRKKDDYADKIEASGTTGTVTRKMRKWILTGSEPWYKASSSSKFYTEPTSTYRALVESGVVSCVCTHYKSQENVTSGLSVANLKCAFRTNYAFYIGDDTYSTADDFKTYLAQQYANGTPVTVWYVLATEQTETVTVPTLTPQKGSNTLTVGTTLQPSEVSITGHIKETT